MMYGLSDFVSYFTNKPAIEFVNDDFFTNGEIGVLAGFCLDVCWLYGRHEIHIDSR